MNKIRFLHIPKTAGCSLKSTLGSEVYTYGHEDINKRPIQNGEIILSVCRNPYDRFVSMFYFFGVWIERSKQHPSWVNDIDYEYYNFAKSIDFDITLFAKHLYDTNFRDGKWLAAFKPQTEYCGGMFDKIYFCRFEQLQQDLDLFCMKYIGKTFQLNHTNKTKPRVDNNYYTIYNNDLQCFVSELYYDDFINFNYSFDVD